LRLSVLIPARDAARTIVRAVTTTLNALPPASEILVLDDGSTDGTAALVEGLSDTRVRVLTGDTPSGVAGALNVLLSEARGEFIARMDADDLTVPGRFKVQLSRLTAGVDVSFGSVIHFGEKLRYPYPSPPLSISPKAFPVALLIANPVAHSTMAARRSTILDLGGYRRCAAEDYDLWLRAAAQGLRLDRSPRPMTALRRHAMQVTATPDWATRALQEPEWRESYLRLAHHALRSMMSPRLESDLVAAQGPAQMRRALSGLLTNQIQAQRPIDRMALATLRRRIERQDPAA
jgi:glycosyltransferase involved in cell wall biosynthesis